MKQEFTNYFQIASSINEPYQVRKKIISLAVGYACACSIDIPSGKVLNMDEHFIVNASSSIRRWVGYFNEVMPMDVTEACEVARKFWIMRYSAVYNCPNLDIVEGNFFASLFGAPNHFDEGTIAILNEFNKEIASTYRAACLVLDKWSTSN